MILPRYSHLLAGLLPDARVKIYPDSAHGFLFQHHQEFAADVHAFLEEVRLMPMIDVYAAEGTFPDPHVLARDLAAAVMRWEQVPDLPLFANNTAAFIHDMDAATISNVAAESNYVRVQVLTP